MTFPSHFDTSNLTNKLRSIETTSRSFLGIFCLLFAISGFQAFAQDSNLLQGTVKGGFKVAVSDGDKVTMVLRGEDKIGPRITDLSIQFNEDTDEAKPKFFATSPACDLNQNTGDITSTDAIQFRTADESFVIEGMGWAWLKSQSLLIISNKVSTIIRKDFIQTPSTKTEATENKNGIITVQSDRFTFKRTTSQASFQNNVKAEDPGKLTMSCNLLQIDLGEDTDKLKEVMANGDVQLNLLDPNLQVEAKSGRAIYSFGSGDKGTLELLDAPTWSAPNYEGGGDRIVVSDVESGGEFIVLGNAHAKLDPKNIRQQALANQDTQASLIEVTADQYNFDGKEVRFEGLVKASQRQNWTLQCDTLTAGVNQTSRQVGEIEAKGNVRLTQMRQGTTMRSSADHALYRPLLSDSESIVLTGSAEVNTGEYLARGQSIELVQVGKQQTIDVSGLATLELPMKTVMNIGILNLPGTLPKESATSEPSRLRVTSERYQFADQKAMFENKVKVYFSDSTMECNRMDVQFTPDRTGIESLLATGNILFSGDEGRMTCRKVEGFFSEDTHQMERLVATDSVRLTHPMGKAKGDQAIFYPETATIHLEGNPQVVAKIPSTKPGLPKYFYAEGGVLYWNQARNRFSGKGMTVKTIDNPDLW